MYSSRSGNYGHKSNITSDYRGSINAGTPSLQQNYGNSYGGGNTFHAPPPPQPPYYGQPPPQMAPQHSQMYHQPISNVYQQMGQIPRPLNLPQQLDTRDYGQSLHHQMSMQNRS